MGELHKEPEKELTTFYVYSKENELKAFFLNEKMADDYIGEMKNQGEDYYKSEDLIIDED